MFKFFGSKFKVIDRYPAPSHDLIVEPFAGSASYAVAHRDHDVLLYEKDERVVALWVRLLAMSSDEIANLSRPAAGDVSDDLLVALAAGRTTRDTPLTFQVSPRMAQRFDPMVRRIASVVDECRHFVIKVGSYDEAPNVEATWFIDPPYQHQGGRWDRTRGGRYAHPNRDIDYRQLAAWTVERRGQVIACEQDGADWLPWTHRFPTHDNQHSPYDEVAYVQDHCAAASGGDGEGTGNDG